MSLVKEGRCIQQRITNKKQTRSSDDDLVKSFAKLMRQGRIGAAIRLLSRNNSCLLDLNTLVNGEEGRTVLDELIAKHPNKAAIEREALLSNATAKDFHPVIFESITGESIHRSALKTTGSAGPSGIDALEWRRLCTSFKHSADIMFKYGISC